MIGTRSLLTEIFTLSLTSYQSITKAYADSLLATSAPPSDISVSLEEEENKDPTSNPTRHRLRRIAEHACGMTGIDEVLIRDRKHRAHAYPQCVTGRDLVDFLIRQKYAKHIRQAVQVGQAMITDGILVPAASTIPPVFHNVNQFYRFHHDFHLLDYKPTIMGGGATSALSSLSPTSVPISNILACTIPQSDITRLSLPTLELTRMCADMMRELSGNEFTKRTPPSPRASPTSPPSPSMTAASARSSRRNSNSTPSGTRTSPAPNPSPISSDPHRTVFSGREWVTYLKQHGVVSSTRDAMLVGIWMMQQGLISHVPLTDLTSVLPPDIITSIHTHTSLLRTRDDIRHHLFIQHSINHTHIHTFDMMKIESDDILKLLGFKNSRDCWYRLSDGRKRSIPQPSITTTTSIIPSREREPDIALQTLISRTKNDGILISSEDVSLTWEFVQSFGDDTSAYDFDDADDLVTAVEFNHSGEYLAIGDKAGRVSIVQETVTPSPIQPLEYKFYTEFQSHDPEFDCLKSTEIEPKINVIEWWRRQSQSRLLLTSNDKTVKLWRLSTRSGPTKRSSLVKDTPMATSSDDESPAPPEEDPTPIHASRRKLYRNAHGYNIHSVSVNSDGESFFSADDLRINLWNVDHTDECYTIVDLKPPEMTEIDELITVARFHPFECNILMHGSSKGVIRLADLRQKALVDRDAHTVLQTKTSAKKTYFSEITDSILDAKFSPDGRYLLARDYMTLRLWDAHMTTRPIVVSHVHPQLASQFVTLLDNEAIFDQFQCAMSSDGLNFVSGSYSNCFILHSVLSSTTTTIKARDDAREPLIVSDHISPPLQDIHRGIFPRVHTRTASTMDDAVTSEHDISIRARAILPDVDEFEDGSGGQTQGDVPHLNHRKKVLKVAWHPRINAVAVAGLFKLYLYQRKESPPGGTAAPGAELGKEDKVTNLPGQPTR